MGALLSNQMSKGSKKFLSRKVTCQGQGTMILQHIRNLNLPSRLLKMG